jgi:hypothetical protein
LTPKRLETKPVQTAHVDATLRQFASDSFTPLAECDFILHGVYTYIKNCHMESFGKYTNALKERYRDGSQLINDRVTFRQVYKITLLRTRANDLVLDYALEYDPHRTHPILHLRTSSSIPRERYKPQDLFLLLVKEVNKIKAREGMLIGLYSEAMIQDIKKFVKRLYTGRFTSDYAILLFSGIEPELAAPSRLQLHFQRKNIDRQLKEVEAGELLVEFTKPVYGRAGLNAFGRRVSPGSVKNDPFLGCEIDDATIATAEDAQSIRLYSKKRGYVDYTPEQIEISNRLTLDTIKRVHSQVAKEEENEVEVVITQNDITQDSVGEGVHLTSERIHISGHIANRAKVEAKTLVVEGATHHGSHLYAHEAVINRHKGVLRCHRADVKLLEGGELHATHVHVETALGGCIYAKRVTLGNVRHHLKVYASDSIIISSINGEDNLFVIDYKKVPIVLSHLQYIEEDIEEQRYHLREAKRRRDKDAADKTNKRIIALKTEIEEIRESSFGAAVTIKHTVRGLNTITFVLPERKTLTYRTREGTTYEPFFLETRDETVTLQPVGASVTL